jgi:S1/P1 Nuclease
VADLLTLNEYPVGGNSEGVSPANQAKSDFMAAATAPDAIKSDHSFVSDGDDADAAPQAGINVGFTDNLMHKYWHFSDTFFLAPGVPGTPPQTPRVNAQERIRLFRQTIASNQAPDPLKAYDLVWLLHIVGDVHQPLHDVSRITANDPGGDQGGNKVKLCLTSQNSCHTKLHGYWDDVLGTGNDVMDAIKAACSLEFPESSDARSGCIDGNISQTPVRPDRSATTDEAVWVSEGVSLAKSVAYKFPPIGEEDGPFPIDQTYKSAAQAAARQQVLLAGARLADLLNNELK